MNLMHFSMIYFNLLFLILSYKGVDFLLVFFIKAKLVSESERFLLMKVIICISFFFS